MSLHDYDKEVVSQLASEHYSDTQIALMYETNPNSVYRFRKKHGIAAGRKGGSQPGCLHRGWKGGRVLDKSGYVLLHRPEHPHATAAGYVREHRIVMEEHLGRFLDPKEVVHHRPDSPKDDNRIENLILYSSNAEHLKDELTGQTPRWSDDGIEKMRENGRNRKNKKGHSPTAEERQVISDRMKGRKPSEETRARMSAAQKAKAPPSLETRAKMSAAAKGRVQAPEDRSKKSVALKGRIFSPEWKEKISQARKDYWRRKRESQEPDN